MNTLKILAIALATTFAIAGVAQAQGSGDGMGGGRDQMPRYGSGQGAGPSATVAADPEQPTAYGSQLMTQQERVEYRNQMRALKTQEERAAFRQEHHNKMRERAKEKGVTLPDAPPTGGMGMGPGGGRGR